jgi:hypothetical protein
MYNHQHSRMRSLQMLQSSRRWRACCSDGQAGRWQPSWWLAGGCAGRPRPGARTGTLSASAAAAVALCIITLQAAEPVSFSA